MLNWGTVHEPSGWISLALSALTILVGAVFFWARLESRAEQIKADMAEEKRQRIESVAEAKRLAELAVANASTLTDRLLTEINDEVRRLRHDYQSTQTMLVGLIEQTARNEGRREAFEEMVKRLVDANGKGNGRSK